MRRTVRSAGRAGTPAFPVTTGRGQSLAIRRSCDCARQARALANELDRTGQHVNRGEPDSNAGFETAAYPASSGRSSGDERVIEQRLSRVSVRQTRGAQGSHTEELRLPAAQ